MCVLKQGRSPKSEIISYKARYRAILSMCTFRLPLTFYFECTIYKKNSHSIEAFLRFRSFFLFVAAVVVISFWFFGRFTAAVWGNSLLLLLLTASIFLLVFCLFHTPAVRFYLAFVVIFGQTGFNDFRILVYTFFSLQPATCPSNQPTSIRPSQVFV